MHLQTHSNRAFCLYPSGFWILLILLFSSSKSIYLSKLEVCTCLCCYFHLGKANIDSTYSLFIRKVDTSGVALWTKTYQSLLSSPVDEFAMDHQQSKISFMFTTGSGLYVTTVSSTNGNMISGWLQSGSMDWGNVYWTMIYSDDDSILFVAGTDSTSNAAVWKYTGSTSIQCYRFTGAFYLGQIAYLPANQIYVSTIDASPYVHPLMVKAK